MSLTEPQFDPEALDEEDDLPAREKVEEGEELEAEGAEGEDEKDQETEETSDDEEFEELELEGKKYRVPAALKSNFMMQADYTRKTQELAEQRREVAERQRAIAHQAEVAESLVEDRANLRAHDASLEQFANLDWGRLFDENPTEAQKLDFQFRRLKEQREQIARGIAQKVHQSTEAAQRETARAAQESARILQQSIPEWGPQLQQKLRGYAQAQGYDEAELGDVTDHRAISILRKAMLYDEIKSGKQAPKPKKSPVKPLAQPPAKGRGPARKGLSDELSAEEWARRRNQELARKQRA